MKFGSGFFDCLSIAFAACERINGKNKNNESKNAARLTKNFISMFHICDLLGLRDFVEAFLNIGFELVEFVSVMDRDTQKGGDENTYRSERG